MRTSYRDIAFHWEPGDASTLRRASLQPVCPGEEPPMAFVVDLGPLANVEITYELLCDPGFAEHFVDALIEVYGCADQAGELLARMRSLVAEEFAEAAAVAEHQVGAALANFVFEEVA